jgi:ABC-2 type transport system permease protein
MIIFYFLTLNPLGMGGRGDMGGLMDPAKAASIMLQRVNWNELFLHAFSRAQLWYFVIALLIGLGTIANDNRANALLVYLSKPCTKMDYLIGKWVAIFVPMTVAAAIPTFFFYFYCLMSYRSDGFLNDPWLILKLGLLVLIPGIFHASASLGISSLFKQGRLAGATYAGIFFFTYFLTVPMGLIHFDLARDGKSVGLVDTAFYCSVDGLQIGLAKALLGCYGAQPVPIIPSGGNGRMGQLAVPAPNGLLFTGALFAISAIFVLIAWSKVRAVEVVG